MEKTFTRKKFWLIFFLALIGIGLFIYFIFSNRTKILPEKPSSEEEFRGDKFEPASQIKWPGSDSWQNKDFAIKALDEDLESGLDSVSCQYKAISYSSDSSEFSSGWWARKCNFPSRISVGGEKWCRFEGERACWVYLSSKDKAGNQHSPAEDKGSVKYYHIDWTRPEVGKVFLGEGKAQVKVNDNLKITGCNLYLDDKNQGAMSFLVPGCQRECQAFKTFNLKLEPGEHRLLAVCQDAAGNYGRSEELLIKENLPPKISFCRVVPTQGTTLSEFQLSVEVTDPDGNNLTFRWEFGDGQSSNKQNPRHNYLNSGTYEPRVKVFDGEGGEDLCSTAWAVVREQ